MSDSGETVTRRRFVQTTAGVAAGSLLGLTAGAGQGAGPGKRRRYAILGTGHRGTGMWGRELLNRHGDRLDVVALCDTNHRRALAARELMGLPNAPVFTSFDEMFAQARPDLLMITTPDSTHADYIARALDCGLDVITEKPMAVDEKQIAVVLEAEKRNNRKIVMAFNYRYAPKHQLIKELLMSGEIGPVTSVDFSWYLDVIHGADYFRRWHRLRAVGGSLFVHKATHHFDLVNWWLASEPEEVTAHADLKRYGRNGAFRHTHCRPCPHQARCEFYWDMTREARLMKLYAEAESEDGYHRDGCVFREDVDIFDTMAALVRYQNGVVMNYSLNAFTPFEGYRLAFNGERGRLEVRDYERQPFTPGEGTETLIEVTRSFGTRQRIPAPPHEDSGHAGGDPRLMDLIFANAPMPEHMRLPDSRAGALSCAIGIAARHSVDQGRPVRIAELVRV